MSWTLAVSAAVDALGAVAYVALGRELFHRASASPERKALRAFGVYWTMTGAYLMSSAVVEGLAAGGAVPLDLAVALRLIGIALACAGLAGLLYYFAYLRTGLRAWRYVIGVVYTAVMLLGVYQVLASAPVGVAPQRWRVDITYERPLEGGLFVPLLLLLLLPPIGAAIGYLRYLPHAPTRLQRVRILVVSAGMAAQLASALVVRMVDGDLAQLVTRPVFGVLVALLVYACYRPPAWLSARLA